MPMRKRHAKRRVIALVQNVSKAAWIMSTATRLRRQLSLSVWWTSQFTLRPALLCSKDIMELRPIMAGDITAALIMVTPIMADLITAGRTGAKALKAAA